MKVVVDTNVFIKALLFNDGHAKRVLQLEADGKLRFVMSEATQKELTDTIFKIAVSKGLALKDCRPLFSILPRCILRAELVRPKKKYDKCSDKSDNKFIECAVAGGCEYIITEDDHLLELDKIKEDKNTKTIQIVPPFQFLLKTKFS